MCSRRNSRMVSARLSVMPSFGGRGKNHKSKRENNESTQCVGKHAKSEQPHVLQSNYQVPEEVSSRHALNHSSCPGIAPNPLLPVHSLALLIRIHHPQGEDIDERALDERNYMDVPVDLPLWRQLRILDGKYFSRHVRRDKDVNTVIEEEGSEDFVDMEGQSWQVKEVCKRLDALA